MGTEAGPVARSQGTYGRVGGGRSIRGNRRWCGRGCVAVNVAGCGLVRAGDALGCGAPQHHTLSGRRLPSRFWCVPRIPRAGLPKLACCAFGFLTEPGNRGTGRLGAGEGALPRSSRAGTVFSREIAGHPNTCTPRVPTASHRPRRTLGPISLLRNGVVYMYGHRSASRWVRRRRRGSSAAYTHRIGTRMVSRHGKRAGCPRRSSTKPTT